jgi:hypothetical protein
MSAITASVGRRGLNNPSDVRVVQSLLNQHVQSLGLKPLAVDGDVGPKTIGAIEAFQRRIGFAMPDGKVDPGGRTFQALDGGGKPAAPASDASTVAGATRDARWPPRPSFPPLVSNDVRASIFGKFEYVADPKPDNPENIRILGDWVHKNIVTVSVDMGPNLGMRKMQFHRLASKQLTQLWADWKGAGLLERVLTYGGSFVPRFVRKSKTTLSNHSFGSAFDINMKQNALGKVPALLGDEGCVRELVGIANRNGFYWGGHFSRLDGMHFEIAKLQ